MLKHHHCKKSLTATATVVYSYLFQKIKELLLFHTKNKNHLRNIIMTNVNIIKKYLIYLLHPTVHWYSTKHFVYTALAMKLLTPTCYL